MAAAEAAAARRKQESFCSLWCWFCWLADDGSKAMAMPRGTRVPHKFSKMQKSPLQLPFSSKVAAGTLIPVVAGLSKSTSR